MRAAVLIEVSIGVLILVMSGCGAPIASTPLRIFPAAQAELVTGLAACAPEQPNELDVDPTRDVVVLVHGCSASGGQLAELSRVFAADGQQTLCFNYDDRDSITASARSLVSALRWLDAQLEGRSITVVGHSQGGLVARHALTNPIGDAAGIRLVTISAPFNGIEAATHCGWTPLHVVTLGATVAICQLVAGSKWGEIHPSSQLVRQPRPLGSAVGEHIAIVTDERRSCRRRSSSGRCEEDDDVFSLAEQKNPRFTADARYREITIGAGHTEVIGVVGAIPQVLVEVLAERRVLFAGFSGTRRGRAR